MKKIFTIIGSILAIVVVSGAIIAAPGIAERQRIARSRIATYKNDRYIGWALALNAIQEANDTFIQRDLLIKNQKNLNVQKNVVILASIFQL